VWKCSSCTKTKTVFEESFFSLIRKPLKILLALIKCWAAQLTVSKAISLIDLNFNEKISDDLVMSMYYRLRQVCTLSIDKKT
jgi:hypothetical protein